jgi:hypothetical protein
MADTKSVKQPSEGRVNVPLGLRKKELRAFAKREGTTETNFARTLIFYCLDKIKAGDLRFSGPSIQETSAEEAR